MLNCLFLMCKEKPTTGTLENQIKNLINKGILTEFN